MKVDILKKQLVFVYTSILLYLVVGYFYGNTLTEKGFYEFIKNYFGISSFIIITFSLIGTVFCLIKCQKKKMIFKIRFKFFILFFCSVVVVYFAKKIGIPCEKVFVTEEQLKKLVEMGLYKYHIGVFFIFVLGWLYTRIMGLYLYIGASIIIFISSFFLFAKTIRITISSIIWNIREKRRLKRERILLQEQIKLKEFYEQLEREHQLKEKQKKELLEQIQKERIEMEKIGMSEDLAETSENNDSLNKENVKKVDPEKEESQNYINFENSKEKEESDSAELSKNNEIENKSIIIETHIDDIQSKIENEDIKEKKIEEE